MGRLYLLLKGAKFHICMGCLFSQQDAHIYCENGHWGACIHGHRDAYIHVTTGTWDAYFWGYLDSLDTGSDRFPYLAHPLLGAYLLTTYTYQRMHLLTRVYSITVQCKTCAHWLFNKD